MDKKTEQGIAGDGIDRRGFLKCMAWVGTGLVWTVGSGIPGCAKFGEPVAEASKGDFSFAQISDSHIGFSKEPNKDVTATLQVAIDKLNVLKEQPSFLLHTGDLTHLSKPEEFDTVAFPQPEPGKAASPGPIKNVAADKLKSVLGVTQINYAENKKSLATIDSSLE
jgi:hypothetical protein